MHTGWELAGDADAVPRRNRSDQTRPALHRDYWPAAGRRGILGYVPPGSPEAVEASASPGSPITLTIRGLPARRAPPSPPGFGPAPLPLPRLSTRARVLCAGFYLARRGGIVPIFPAWGSMVATTLAALQSWAPRYGAPGGPVHHRACSVGFRHVRAPAALDRPGERETAVPGPADAGVAAPCRWPSLSALPVVSAAGGGPAAE